MTSPTIQAIDAAAPPRDVPHPKAWPAAIVLVLAVVVYAADKELPKLLMEPVKASFGLSDARVALLTGFSFTMTVSLMAIPLSWIADRYNRALLITLAIATWCSMTVASAFAQDFWSMFVLRMGVGLGEAALIPAAYSLMADLFPPRLIARPLALAALGAILGESVAKNGGGLVYELFRRPDMVRLTGLPAADAWRATLVLIGGLGLLVAVAAWRILPEPRKTRAPRSAAATAALMGLTPFLKRTAFFFTPLTLSMVAYTLFSAGFFGWLAPFFQRTYGWSIGQIGQVLGLVTLITGLVGAPFGAIAKDIVSRRLGRDAPAATIGVLVAMSVPAAILAPLAPNGWISALFIGLSMLPAVAATVLTPAVFTASSPGHLRARVVAISYLIFGVLGSSQGQFVYALFSEHVFHGPHALSLTMAVLSGLFTAISAALLFVADRAFVRMRKVVEESPEESFHHETPETAS